MQPSRDQQPETPLTHMLPVDEVIYHRTAVLRACYWFTEHCYIFVVRAGDHRLDVHLRAKPATSPERFWEIVGDFENALLDYEIRRQIEEETGAIRELLVCKAVGDAGALDDAPPGSADDPVDMMMPPETGLVQIRPSRA